MGDVLPAARHCPCFVVHADFPYISGHELSDGLPMIDAYIPIFLILAVATIFGVVSVNMSWLLGPQRPNRSKNSTYESGMEPVRTAHDRFSVKYYMVAVLFILFDIEVVFMYPWAVQYRNLGAFGFVEMVVFIAILLVGYVYILKKGALQWD
jgi:NADH-quinone oxidoreductase subunit A